MGAEDAKKAAVAILAREKLAVTKTNQIYNVRFRSDFADQISNK